MLTKHACAMCMEACADSLVHAAGAVKGTSRPDVESVCCRPQLLGNPQWTSDRESNGGAHRGWQVQLRELGRSESRQISA